MKKKKVESLIKSPVFALTLGSKELSHSNFWAWLIEQKDENCKHPFIEVFVPGFYKKGYSFHQVLREYKNRDISIYYYEKKPGKTSKRKCLIIENKIKSIPTEKQLLDYEESVDQSGEGEFVGGILTGLLNTLKPKPLPNWNFMSYSEIARKIRQINKTFLSDNHDIIEQYASVIDNISDLIEKHLDDSKNMYFLKAPDDLQFIRLGDIFLKLKAEMIKKEFEGKIASLKITSKKWGQPIVETTFNRGKATISVIYVWREKTGKKDESKEKARLGVQLEGNQFRIYGGPGFAQSKLKSENKLAEALLNCGWFEPYDKKTIRKKATSMKKEFCKYNTQNYLHEYQYWDINDNMEIDDLWKEIEPLLKEAKRIIDNGRIAF